MLAVDWCQYLMILRGPLRDEERGERTIPVLISGYHRATDGAGAGHSALGYSGTIPTTRMGHDCVGHYRFDAVMLLPSFISHPTLNFTIFKEEGSLSDINKTKQHQTGIKQH